MTVRVDYVGTFAYGKVISRIYRNDRLFRIVVGEDTYRGENNWHTKIKDDEGRPLEGKFWHATGVDSDFIMGVYNEENRIVLKEHHIEVQRILKALEGK